MRLSGLLLLAAVSLSLAAPARTRPRYGRTLRLSMREAPASLDPSEPSRPGNPLSPSLSRLIFDTLVTLDAHGRAQPALASTYQFEQGYRRWRFNLRRGVSFHDGTALSSDAVAASLRAVNPNWKVFATGDAVVIECDAPTADLPSLLALPRYGIAKRAGGKIVGSGPFAITAWDPGKKLVLTARDDYWGGRAFVDSIEVEMGKSFREQMIALDLAKTSVVEIAPDQARHAALEGRRIESSAPEEWMALVFSRDVQSTDDGKLREALALSMDRDAMNSVLLQGGGESAGGFLPNWLTGYAFLFPTAVDLQQARRARDAVRQAPVWTLAYDASDPLARVIAERIALNAHDAGLTLQITTATVSDIRLVRRPLPSLDAWVALGELAGSLGLRPPQSEVDPLQQSSEPFTTYAAESSLLQSQRVIPLLHLRSSIALSVNVMGWQEDPDGSWRLQNLWLETRKP